MFGGVVELFKDILCCEEKCLSIAIRQHVEKEISGKNHPRLLSQRAVTKCDKSSMVWMSGVEP